jgi:DNA topoisomerase I
VHDPTVTWLAYWRENVMGSFKYVFLAASSSFKGKADMAKYDKVRAVGSLLSAGRSVATVCCSCGQARRLCLNIDRIRSTYEKLLKSSDDLRVQQLATAIWIIDR